MFLLFVFSVFCCMVNRLISLLMWDLGVFDFIEGADTDQGAVAPHGLSAAAAKIREMKSVTPSISHDKAVQAIILDQIWDPSWKEKKKSKVLTEKKNNRKKSGFDFFFSPFSSNCVAGVI